MFLEIIDSKKIHLSNHMKLIVFFHLSYSMIMYFDFRKNFEIHPILSRFKIQFIFNSHSFLILLPAIYLWLLNFIYNPQNNYYSQK